MPRVIGNPFCINMTSLHKTKPIVAPATSETPATKKLFHGKAPLEVIVDPVLGDQGRLAVKEKFEHLMKTSNGTSRLYMNDRYESKTAYQEFLARYFTTLLFIGLVPAESSIVLDWQSDIVTLSQTKDAKGNSVFDRTCCTYDPSRSENCVRHKDEMFYLSQHHPMRFTESEKEGCHNCGLVEHPGNLIAVGAAKPHKYAAFSSIFSYGRFPIHNFLEGMVTRTTGYIALNDFVSARRLGKRSGLLMDSELNFTFCKDGQDDRVVLQGPGILGKVPVPFLNVVADAWMVRKLIPSSSDRPFVDYNYWLFETVETMRNGDVDAKMIKVTKAQMIVPGLEIVPWERLEGYWTCNGVQHWTSPPIEPVVINLETQEVKKPVKAKEFAARLKSRFGKQLEDLIVEENDFILTTYKSFYFAPRVVDRVYRANADLVSECLLESFGKTGSSDILRANRVVNKSQTKNQTKGLPAMDRLELWEDNTQAMVIAMHIGAVQFGTVQSYNNGSHTQNKARETLKGVVYNFTQRFDWAMVGKFLLVLMLVLLCTAGVILVSARGEKAKIPPAARMLSQDDASDSVLILLKVVLYYILLTPLVVVFFKLMRSLCKRRFHLRETRRLLSSSCVFDNTRLDLEANEGRYPAN